MLERLLAQRHQVERLATRFTRHRHDADDIAQDTWLRALRSPPRHDTCLAAWLARVTRNAAATDAQRARLAVRQAIDLPEDLAVAADPVEILSRRDQKTALRDALATLPAPQRRALELRYLDGMPPRAIAARDGISVETVYTRLRRGIAAVRARLGDGATPPPRDSAPAPSTAE